LKYPIDAPRPACTAGFSTIGNDLAVTAEQIGMSASVNSVSASAFDQMRLSIENMFSPW
jgi:hypothetical protein